jgi:hypothetical protein
MEMNNTTEQLAKALTVMVIDPKIRGFLQDNDPMALKQAQEALRNHFNQIEKDEIEDTMNDYNYVGSRDHY